MIPINNNTTDEIIISKHQLNRKIEKKKKKITKTEKNTAMKIIDKNVIKNSIILASIKFFELIPKILKIKF